MHWVEAELLNVHLPGSFIPIARWPSDADGVGHEGHLAIGNKDNDVVVGLIGTGINEANLKIIQEHRELFRKKG